MVTTGGGEGGGFGGGEGGGGFGGEGGGEGEGAAPPPQTQHMLAAVKSRSSSEYANAQEDGDEV